MKYLQAKEPDESGLRSIVAVNDAAIETEALSNCYGAYGQRIGSYYAGDYLYIVTQEAADAANRAYNEYEENDEFVENYKVNDLVAAYEDSVVYDEICNHEGVECHAFECEAITFWDGSNFKSIIISSDNPDFDGDWEFVSDELAEELDAAIENMEQDGEATGYCYFKSGDWRITESFWQGSWERYTITPI